MPIPKKGSKKEKIFSRVKGFEIKESDTGDLIRGGYIATTHLDSGFFDEERGVYIKDQIPRETLEKWAGEINDGVPRANKVSINHNRDIHVAGVGVKGTARVDALPDGESGLYVETLVDKTKEDFQDTEYRIDKGLLDSFSIEFITRDPATSEYLSGIAEEESEGFIVRTLGVGTQLEGWTLASQPMNEHAVMIKEIREHKTKSEEITMEKKEEEVAPVEEPKAEAPVVEEPKPAEPVAEEPKEEPKEESPAEEKEYIRLGKERKAELEKQKKEASEKKFEEKIKDEVAKSLKEVKVEEKVQMNKEEDKIESKELQDYKEAVFEHPEKHSIEKQFKMAGKLHDSLGLRIPQSKTIAEEREFKNFTTNGAKLEFKALGVGTNTTAYTQSVAELSDVYDPVINNTLNQQTVLFNILAKDDFSSKGNNQVQFTVKDVANTSAAAYTGNAVTTGNVGREKNMTKFKKYQVGVEVDGDMIAAARGGPIGDVFALEVRDSTMDLLSVINVDLFTEKGAETDAELIGLPYMTDAAGNATLYSLTRSSHGYMDGNSGATYINASSNDISIALLRQAIRQSTSDAGSMVDDLVFVCNWVQYHKFLAIYDNIQRVVPTSSRFGFEGRPEIDGIPIFVDKDCKSGSWFIINMRWGYRIAMWVPPTLEMLGKDADSQKGFIKTYLAAYSRNPNMLAEVYGAATS